jgi:hypothetical protein
VKNHLRNPSRQKLNVELSSIKFYARSFERAFFLPRKVYPNTARATDARSRRDFFDDRNITLAISSADPTLDLPFCLLRVLGSG